MLTAFCDSESQHNFPALPHQAALQAAEETPHHSKVSVATANQRGCNKWWHRFLPPVPSNLHPQRTSEFIFVQISTGTSDNAALFSSSHKLGIHQPGLLPPNGDSTVAKWLGWGWDCSVSETGKVQEEDRLHPGRKHWVNSLRQKSEAFQSQGERKDGFPPPAPGSSVKHSVWRPTSAPSQEYQLPTRTTYPGAGFTPQPRFSSFPFWWYLVTRPLKKHLLRGWRITERAGQVPEYLISV